MANKPTKLKPKVLGTGMAYKAGKALKGRKSKIDAALAKAMGTKKKKSNKQDKSKKGKK